MKFIELIDEEESKLLYQWDLNRQVKITLPEGLEANEVHFAHQRDKEALVVRIKEQDGVHVADIPNILLQSNQAIKVWLVKDTRTLYGTNLVVIERIKPSDYIYTETEILRYELLKIRIENLEKEVKEIKENGSYAGATDAVQYVEQGLAEEQKKQARKNIGAASVDEVSKLSEEKVDKIGITLGKHTDGLIYVFVDGKPVGNGLNLSAGGSVEPSNPDTPVEPDNPDIPLEPEVEPTLFSVNWLDTAYGIGDNTTDNYNAWSPNCSHYDSETKKVLFLQCHTGSHSATNTKDSQLWSINPYNVMECELITTFPIINGKVPLGFEIYKGKYYVVATNKVYVSNDKGVTWDSYDTSIPRAYGLYIIDGVMYVGDDSMNVANNGVYYTSSDYGVNWETKTFDFAGKYNLKCSEAVFCKHNGKLYASLRRETEAGILACMNNGVWEVVIENLPNLRSDCTLYSVEDNFVYCAINRDSRTLYLGTINDETFEISIDKTLNFSNNTEEGDFHTPSYVYGDDFQMVTFMIGATSSAYVTAMNVALVGYTDLSKSENISYAVSGGAGTRDIITETPYIGSPPNLLDGGLLGFTADTVINTTERLIGSGKIIGDNFYMFSPVKDLGLSALSTINQNSFGCKMFDWFEHDGEYYSVLVKKPSTAQVGLDGLVKIISKANKVLMVEKVSEKIVKGDKTEFDYATYAHFNASNNGVGYLRKSVVTVAEPKVLS